MFGAQQRNQKKETRYLIQNRVQSVTTLQGPVGRCTGVLKRKIGTTRGFWNLKKILETIIYDPV